MLNRDVNKLEKEFIRIKNLGFVKNVRPNNDGGVGNTFEDHLGVDENNETEPDFEGFEVKTKRSFTSSYTSLFTKKPSYPNNGDTYMRDEFGIYDEEYPSIKCFRTSIYSNRWSHVHQNAPLVNQLKIKIEVDYEKQKVYFVVANLDEKIINKKVFWTFEDIEKGYKKLNDLFVVKAEVKKENNEEFFHYKEANVFLQSKDVNEFIKLIEEGVVRYDNRLGIYRTGPHTGKPHNHGGGFRIASRNINRIYNKSFQIN